MTEEQFLKAEEERLRVERQKIAAIKGTPMPGSVEEFLRLFEGALSKDPLLKEYITREHAENRGIIETLQRYYERRLQDQESMISKQAGEIAELKREFLEYRDNFNLYANEMLNLQRAHNQRIKESLDKLDAEP